MKISVLKVVGNTAADGPGLRTSVYLAGCIHRCPSCHNPQSWNIVNGTWVKIDDLIEEIKSYGNRRVTITGGDPFYQYVPLVELVGKLKKLEYDIWLYTGYTLEELEAGAFKFRDGSVGHPGFCRMMYRLVLNKIDGLVDGPFKLEEKDTSLRFRGSRNQKIYLRDSQGVLREDQGKYSS